MDKKFSKKLLFIILAGGSIAWLASVVIWLGVSGIKEYQNYILMMLPFEIPGTIACLFYVVTLGFMLLYKTDARSHKTSRLYTNLAMLGWIAYLICDGGFGFFFIAFNGEWDLTFKLLWLLAPPLLIAGVTLALCIGSFRQLKKDV